MHPALHRKNTPSLALNKYLKILVFYFYYFLRIGFEFFHAVQPPRPVGTPPIFLTGTPRNATGHGKGKREIHYPIPVIEGIHTSPLCFEQNIGEKEQYTLYRNLNKNQTLPKSSVCVYLQKFHS